MKTRIIICGACGKMGGTVLELLAGDENAVAVAGVDLYPREIGIPVYKSFADVKKLCTLIFEGKFDEAIALNDKLLPVANACFCEVNPIPVKAAMNMLGFDAGTPRAPLTKIEPQNREKLLAAMKNFGLECKA